MEGRRYRLVESAEYVYGILFLSHRFVVSIVLVDGDMSIIVVYNQLNTYAVA